MEGLMLKLKLQYFGHLMQRANSLEKTLMLGKIEGRRWRGRQGQDGWMASLTQWTWVSANSKRWWRTEKPSVLQSMGSQRVRHNWTTTKTQFKKKHTWEDAHSWRTLIQRLEKATKSQTREWEKSHNRVMSLWNSWTSRFKKIIKAFRTKMLYKTSVIKAWNIEWLN